MGILLNITGGHELGLFEVNEAAEIVQSAADSDSNIIFGAVIDDAMGDEVRVTVIAAGFDRWAEGDHGRRAGLGLGESESADVFGAGEEFDLGEDDFDVPSFLK